MLFECGGALMGRGSLMARSPHSRELNLAPHSGSGQAGSTGIDSSNYQVCPKKYKGKYIQWKKEPLKAKN